MVMCDGRDSSSRHEEIVFDQGECPLCEIDGKLTDGQKEINEAASAVDDELIRLRKVMKSKMETLPSNPDIANTLMKVTPMITLSELETIITTLDEIHTELDGLN